MSSLRLLPELPEISKAELLDETHKTLQNHGFQLAFTMILESLSKTEDDKTSLFYKAVFETVLEASCPEHPSYVEKLAPEEARGYRATLKLAQAFTHNITDILEKGPHLSAHKSIGPEGSIN